MSEELVTLTAIPQHVAIIMDGNGRWANQRNRPRVFGHSAGLKSLKKVIEACVSHRVLHLTLFAFSSENWGRPAGEVSRLMGLFMSALDKEVTALHDKGVKLRFIGDLDRFSSSLKKKMHQAEHKTAENQKLYVNFAVNYGGYWDICQAAKKLLERVQEGHLSVDEITPGDLSELMSLRPDPPPDLLIRSGGEQRISNFLLWDIAYSELYFTDTLWPDFNEQDFSDALVSYAARQRRFGLTGHQVEGSKTKR